MAHKILIVEDDEMQRQMLSTLLERRLKYKALLASNGREGLDVLERDNENTIKLAVLDLNMPVMDGFELLDIIRQRYPTIPVIMVTGNNDIEVATKAIKMGAVDFLTKPYERERICVSVKNALKMGILSKEVTRLQKEKDGTFTFENLIGYNGGLIREVEIGRKAAQTDLPVLITGETGTGKEVYAKALHGESNRAGKPFVAVNCGAIPAQLVESTLFGHEKGSFTGATEAVLGKFREAEGGTIFLDEVGELPLEVQVKLLRVLQQKEVEPVGAGRPVKINVRILSATNRDLQEEVNESRFREDLYFRLNVLHTKLPPLRQRADDIPALVHHFMERFSLDSGDAMKQVSDHTMSELCKFKWPGNIRQLENNINRAIVMSGEDEITAQDFSILSGRGGDTLQNNVRNTDKRFVPDQNAANLALFHANGMHKTVAEIEAEVMQRALAHYDGNITQTAKALGMAKSTFYKKIQKP